MKHLLLAGALCTLPAYAAEPVEPTRDLTNFNLTIVWMAPRQVAERCAGLGAWGGNAALAVRVADRQPIGCAVAHHAEARCTVYVSKPEHVDDARTTVLGHEVLHCAIGRYHSEGVQ